MVAGFSGVEGADSLVMIYDSRAIGMNAAKRAKEAKREPKRTKRVKREPKQAKETSKTPLRNRVAKVSKRGGKSLSVVLAFNSHFGYRNQKQIIKMQS